VFKKIIEISKIKRLVKWNWFFIVYCTFSIKCVIFPLTFISKFFIRIKKFTITIHSSIIPITIINSTICITEFSFSMTKSIFFLSDINTSVSILFCNNFWILFWTFFLNLLKFNNLLRLLRLRSYIRIILWNLNWCFWLFCLYSCKCWLYYYCLVYLIILGCKFGNITYLLTLISLLRTYKSRLSILLYNLISVFSWRSNIWTQNSCCCSLFFLNRWWFFFNNFSLSNTLSNIIYNSHLLLLLLLLLLLK